MSSEILRWLTSLGLAGVALAVVQGLFLRRKLSADTVKVITEAATGTLKDVREENILLRQRLTAAETRLDTVERDNRRRDDHAQQVDALIVVHGVWDRQAFYAAKEHGLNLPEPPPLTIGATQ